MVGPWRLGLGVTISSLICVSCATAAPPRAVSLEFFHPAPGDDPWNAKIQEWQQRHRLDLDSAADRPSPKSTLAEQYSDFEISLKRQVAARATRWIQEQSRHAYRPDGAFDHWATLGEVLSTGGDDCDGLDLLTFQLLRRFGFEEREIERAILVEKGSGQHHMVTLWFEKPGDSDPFVLDPTGVASSGLSRLSELQGWAPIETFDEETHYRIQKLESPASVAGR